MVSWNILVLVPMGRWCETVYRAYLIFLLCSHFWCNIVAGACPDAWEEDGQWCYFFNVGRVNYNTAQEECIHRNSDLTSVHSQDEQMFLEGKANGAEMWIGLNDRTTEGTFEWTDGTATNFYDWFCGVFCAPCDFANIVCRSRDCVYLESDGKWYDGDCSDTKGYICKTPSVQSTTAQFTTSWITTSTPMTTNLEPTSYLPTSQIITTFAQKSTQLSSNSQATSISVTQKPSHSTSPHTTLTSPKGTFASPKDPGKQEGNLNIGLIVGSAIGSVAVIIVLILIILFLMNQRKSSEVFSNTGQAYDGPYDLTMEGNESMFIQRNGTVTYKNRNSDIDHNDPVAYENHMVDLDQGEPSGTTDMSGPDTSEKSQTPAHQMSVVYSKPMKRKSRNSDEKKTYENQEILSDKKEDHLYEDPCETENVIIPETKEQEIVNYNNDGFNEENDEEGWEENSIYSGVSKPEDDLSDDITYEDVTGSDVEVPNKDIVEATYDQPETIVQDSNEEYSEIKDIGSAESTGLEGLHDKDSRSSEGWEDNDMYSISD